MKFFFFLLPFSFFLRLSISSFLLRLFFLPLVLSFAGGRDADPWDFFSQRSLLLEGWYSLENPPLL